VACTTTPTRTTLPRTRRDRDGIGWLGNSGRCRDERNVTKGEHAELQVAYIDEVEEGDSVKVLLSDS
jgi:hypothetical protein